MGNLVELYIADINNSPQSKINLLGDKVKELGKQGSVFWNPITPPPDNKNIIFESIPVAFLGNTIAETKAKLDIRAKNVQRWKDNRLRKNSTWLYWRYTHSPLLQRDLILSISWGATGSTDAHLIQEYLSGNITVGRRGRWEAFKNEGVLTESLPTGGAFFEVPNFGTEDSRVLLLQVDTPPLAANPFLVDEYWVGIREVLEGIDDFNPILPLASGRRENGLDATGFLNMAVPDILRRFRVTVGEVIGIGNPTHYVGRYVVLLKQDSSDNETVYILKYGNRANDTLKNEYRRVYVKSSGLQWVNLGEIEIPAGINRIGSVTDIRNSEIEIWIGRTSGAGTVQLSLNPILLVPSRHYLNIKSESLTSNGATQLQYKTHEDYSKSYELRASTGELLTGVPNPRNFIVPFDGGILVYASQRNNIADDTGTDLSTITLNYYNSYASYARRKFKIIKSEC